MQQRVRLFLIGTLFIGGALPAQSADTLLKKDARVRIWSIALGYSSMTGVVESRTRDSLILRLNVGINGPKWVVAHVANSQLDTVQVQVKTGKTAKEGGRRGVMVGGLLGALVGAVSAASAIPSGDGLGTLRGPAAVLGALVGGLAGAAIGGPIGLASGAAQSARWVTVPIPRP